MPTAIILCGPPGSGKSTWYAQHKERLSHYLYASTDSFINTWASEAGLTYEESFQDLYPRAEEHYNALFELARDKELYILVDRTNTTEASRKRTLAKIPAHFNKVAIYFPSYTVQVLQQRIDKRAKEGGHGLSPSVIVDMHKQYKIPNYSEGFNLVLDAAEASRILKIEF